MKTPTKKKIVVIDDDLLFLEILKFQLDEVQEAEIETYTSAEKCLEEMQEQPDLVILDYNLGNGSQMTGHAALGQFQELDSAPPILFISGKINEGLLEDYEKYRSVDFMLKDDITESSIKQRISHLLQAS